MKKTTTFFVALFALLSATSMNAQNYSDDFESSSSVPSGWRTANFIGGSPNATLSINTGSVLTGKNALECVVTANVGNWFENVAGYSFAATTGDQYDIAFDAKASTNITVPAKLNTDGDKQQTEIISASLSLTTTSKHFTLTTTSGCTMTMNYLFWIELNGQNAGTTIDIDKFSLKKKGTDGLHDVSNVNIRYYPNPAKDFVLINGENQGSEVAIYSLAGQVVLSAVVDGKPLSLKNINNGVYILKVGGKAQKLIVEK